MSDFIFMQENNEFLVNTDFNSQNIVKLQGIKPNFFYDNLASNNFIELNVKNEAVAPFFNDLITLNNNYEQSNENVKLFLGLYFVELDSAESPELQKAPLLLLPVVVTKEADKFKLNINSDLNIVTNPILESYSMPKFADFDNLDSYIAKVSEICDSKDYLLKKLSLLSFCEVSTSSKVQQQTVQSQTFDTLESNQEETTFDDLNFEQSFNQEDEQNNLIQQSNSDVNLEDTFDTFENNTANITNNTDETPIQQSTVDTTVSKVSNGDLNLGQTTNYDYLNFTDILQNAVDNESSVKISSKQKDSQLATLQIHPLTKLEKDVIFDVKNDKSIKVTSTNKSNILPLLSNLTLVALQQNKKVLYLSNNKTSINNLHNQIIKDGYENFVTVVDNEIIQNKQDSLFSSPKMDTTFSEMELNALVDAKKTLKLELNDYLKTTHKVFEHMNLTLYDVVQKIMTLKEDYGIQKSYDVVISNITDFSPLDLHRYTFHLNNYVKYFEASKIQLENTFWKNIDFSIAQKEDLTKIENTLSELVTIIEHLNKEDNTIVSATSSYRPSDVKTFYNLYTNINDNIFSTDYIYSIDHDGIIASLNKLVTLQNTFKDYQTDIYEIFNDDIFSSDILLLNNNLQKNIQVIQENLNNEDYSTGNDIVTNIIKTNQSATNLLNAITQSFELADDLSQHFSLSHCESINEIKLLLEMFSFVLENVSINDLWFVEEERENFISILNDIKSLKAEIEEIKNNVTTEYIDDIFTVDYSSLNNQLSIAKDTELDPVATKIYRYLKTFKKDENSNVTFLNATELIANITDYHQKLALFKEYLNYANNFYGKELTIDSDFDKPLTNVTIFDETLKAFNNDIPEKIKTFLLNPTDTQDVLDALLDLNTLVNALNNDVIDVATLENTDKEDLINSLNSIVTCSDESHYIYGKIVEYTKPTVNVDLTKLLETTNKISALVELQDDFENLFEVTSRKVPDLLTSYDINLEETTSDLEVFKKLRKLLNKFDVAENDFYDFAKTIRQEILSNTQRFNYLIDEAIELFKIVFEFANNTAEICQDFEADLTFVNTLQNDFNLAKQGYKFSRSKDECENLGLTDFLQQVQDDNLDPKQIINAFLVSFYTAWFKETLQDVNLKGDVEFLDIHNKINEYFNLCDKIYLYNKSALYSTISNYMPILTTNKSSVDEVNTLLEDIEPNKETNFKSIYNKIPNLIFEIKPCLITNFEDFKNLETYTQLDFDLVILDDSTLVDAKNTTLNYIKTKQVVLLGNENANFVENNIYQSNNLSNINLLALQTKFNYSIAKFLNNHYYNKELFVPYTKNFELDFKNIYLEDSILDSNVNELEAYKVIEVLQQYYSENPNKVSHVVTLTNEQTQFVTNLIQTDEVLSKLLENDTLFVSSLDNIKLVTADFTLLNLCVKDFSTFNTLTKNLSQNVVTILLNTLSKLVVVESVSFLSTLVDDSWNTALKLLFKFIQQFISNNEMYEIEFNKKQDLFINSMVSSLNDSFDVDFTNKNNYTNVYVSEDNDVKLLIQSDSYINNKTDFDDIYLKHVSAQNIDNVKIQNVFGYSWYLSDNYKTFITNEIDKKLKQETEKNESLLVKNTETVDNFKNFFNLVPYELADLYEIEPVNDVTVFVANAITHIVRIESPIHIDLVYEKLHSLLGISNSSFSLEETIASALKTYLDGIIKIQDNFFWNCVDTEVKPRIPVNASTTRYITHIADEELSTILYEIIKKSYGIRLDSLVTSCCKELGFTMQSLTIKNKIFKAYEILLNQNKIINSNNKLKVV